MSEEVIYSCRDEAGYRLRVGHLPDGALEVDAEDADGDERVFVDLPREEGIKLAHAILTALDAEPEQGLTVLALDHKPTGFEVFDKDGDPWQKLPDGRWRFLPGLLDRSPGRLVDEYGPIVAKVAVGSSGHADKTET